MIDTSHKRLQSKMEKTEAVITVFRNLEINENTTTSKYLDGQLKSAWSGH